MLLFLFLLLLVIISSLLFLGGRVGGRGDILPVSYKLIFNFTYPSQHRPSKCLQMKRSNAFPALEAIKKKSKICFDIKKIINQISYLFRFLFYWISILSLTMQAWERPVFTTAWNQLLHSVLSWTVLKHFHTLALKHSR